MEEADDCDKTMDQVLADGKKYLTAGDIEMAVDSFQEACSELAQLFGDLAVELAEPYYLYGKALIEVARRDGSLLGTAIPVPAEEESSNDEDNEGTEPAEDHPQEPSTDQKSSADQEELVEMNGNAVTLSEGEGGDSSSKDNDVSGEGMQNSNSDKPDESCEQEETDFKLAWEILELARIICQKQEGDEYKLKLADVHLALAEVSLESDQIEQAIADQNTCLQLREFILEPHDRRLAEVHFSLGLAYVLSKQPDMAIKHYSSSKDVLQKSLDILNKELSACSGEEKCKSLQKEVEEITELIPDIDSKISDTQEVKRLLEEKEGVKESGFPDAAQTDDDTNEINVRKKAPAMDISHLVRKRVSDSNERNQAKKQRIQDEVEGEEQPTSILLTEQ